MNILVLGNGFVGKPLAEFLGADTTEKRIEDITEYDLEEYDVVINTVAKTSIDWCEKNRLETFNVNVVQAARLAPLVQGKYVFFSSACIFKTETDEVNYEDSFPQPQCFYTYTKLMAEKLIEEIRPDALIIRPRLLISEKSHPRNTIDKLLKYTHIITSQESATILEDLLPKVKELIDAKEEGAFNVFNRGTISPSEIMDIFKHTHYKITKKELDGRMIGKARRVSTILGSIRTQPLPEIRGRIKEIAATWHIDSE